MTVAIVSALAGVVVAFGLTQFAGWASGRVRSGRALWRLETELATVRTAATIAELKTAHARFLLASEPTEEPAPEDSDNRQEENAGVPRRPSPAEAEYLDAVALVTKLPPVKYFLEDSDSIAIGLNTAELEAARNAITFYNLMRSAYPERLPDDLRLMKVVEQMTITTRAMVRFQARFTPREYSKAQKRRKELWDMAKTAAEPYDSLLRGVMIRFYPEQNQPLRFPQTGRWSVVIYRGPGWSLLLTNYLVPITLRVEDTQDGEPSTEGVYFLMGLIAQLSTSGPPSSENYYPVSFPVGGIFQEVVAVAFIEDPQLGPLTAKLGGVTYLAAVGLTEQDLEKIKSQDINAILNARSEDDHLHSEEDCLVIRSRW